MPSRFYLPSTGAAPISPAFSSEWDLATDGDRLAAVTTRIGSAMTTKALDDGSGVSTSNRDRLARQYIYGPIVGNHTITGTIKGQVRCLSSSENFNLRSQLIVRAVAPNGSTFRGTLYAGDTTTLTGDPANEWPITTAANRYFPRGGSQSVTSVSVFDGDYLVFEFGARSHAAVNFTLGSMIFGDDSGTDLPEDETTTAANNPWIELSYNLLSTPASATVSSGTMTLTGQALTAGRVTGDATAVQGTMTLTGQDVVGRQAITAGMTKGDLTLAGQALSGASATATANVFTQATLTLEGQDAQASWDAPDSVILTRALLTLTGKALSAANAESVAEILTGTLTMTGQDVTGRSAVGAIANQGVITLTGQNVSAAAILAAIINQGSLTLTGRGVAISSEARTSTMGRAQITFTGSLVVVRQGFSFYQVHII